ncbi:MAG: quinone-dependent dihydroorotate dehydrogenase [Hyphomicrobiales bacterium]
MARGLYRIAWPILRSMDAERAHGFAAAALQRGLAGSTRPVLHPELQVSVFGLDFPNPVGLAAGFDKNATLIDPLLALGFGFVEVGTITPRPQAGNPKPRLFRLEEHRAVINRMGFNNEGHAAALANIRRRKRRGILGVNVGANKDSADRMHDYVQGVAMFAAVADYITVNISSPNTPGLRALQSRHELTALLKRLEEACLEAGERFGRRVPLLLKIAPDLVREELNDVAEACLASRIDGIIVSNTTITRPASLTSKHRDEAGGLSGEPLFELSTRKLAELYRLVGGRIPLVGAGGISSAATAWEKVRAGASLVQLYSALVYEGPGLVRDIVEGLAQRTRVSGRKTITEMVGTGVADWT